MRYFDIHPDKIYQCSGSDVRHKMRKSFLFGVLTGVALMVIALYTDILLGGF